MAEQFRLVLQGTPEAERTAYSVLANSSRAERFDEAVFIAPFMTELGVRMLNEIAREAEVRKLLWLVGLDGVITTPQAIIALAVVVKDAVQLGWRQSPSYPYLHAKVFFLRRRQPRKIVAYVGSANATYAGLANNVEAGTFITREGDDAIILENDLNTWITELRSLPCCVELNQTEKSAYTQQYRPPTGRGRQISGVIGAGEPDRTAVVAREELAWTEVAVRGGSGNQIEICRDMAIFFLEGASGDRIDFDLVEATTGIVYPQNAYRFRRGNFGHRVEINTTLARALDLTSASARRDIILFKKTQSPGIYLIQLFPARSQRTSDLIHAAESEGRLGLTTRGVRGRRYYV